MDTETLARILFFGLLCSLIAMRVYFSMRVRQAGERLMPDRGAVQREGRASFAIRAILFVLFFAFLITYFLNVPYMKILMVPFPAWLRWTGFALGIVSIAFWTWAQVCLGKLWSPQLQLRVDHNLVTTGPYASIRHPIYTAMFGFGIGLALLTANWVFIALAVLVTAGLIARVPKEERMMVEKFGDQYRTYTQNTGRFFPRKITHIDAPQG